jgi:hypothetical protein
MRLLVLKMLRRLIAAEIHRIAKDQKRYDSDCGFELLRRLGVASPEVQTSAAVESQDGVEIE